MTSIFQNCREVACPKCGAPPGVHCTKVKTGDVTSTPHNERLRAYKATVDERVPGKWYTFDVETGKLMQGPFDTREQARNALNMPSWSEEVLPPDGTLDAEWFPTMEPE